MDIFFKFFILFKVIQKLNIGKRNVSMKFKFKEAEYIIKQKQREIDERDVLALQVQIRQNFLNISIVNNIIIFSIIKADNNF